MSPESTKPIVPEPLISVLMPVREFTAYCVAAVESILNQSHSNLELVIIGKDNVSELLSKLPTDQRIVGVSRTTPGVIGASNTGFDVSTGEYIARMDSDDISHPDRLQIQLAFLKENPHIGLAGACVELFCDETPLGRGNKHYQQWLNSLVVADDIAQACFIESPLPNPSLFAHRSFWEAIGPYRDMGWPEDYDLILRTWLARIAMAKPPTMLLRWREHPQRLTHTDSRYSRQAFINAKAWAITQPDADFHLDTGRSIWICGTGRNARYWHDALIDNGANVSGFVELDSAKPKTQKRYLPVISYDQLVDCKGDSLVLSAISAPSAREALTSWFDAHAMHSGSDYVLGG